MDRDVPPDHCDERIFLADGQEYRAPHAQMNAEQVLELIGKNPEEWHLEAELNGGDRVILDLESELEFFTGRVAIFFTRPRHHHHPHPEACELTIVVASDPIKVQVKKTTLVSAIIQEVLIKAAPPSRPDDQWQLKTELGVVLEPSLSVEAAGIECGTTLFLSLKEGAAGDASLDLLVDPAVSRQKFGTELAAFRIAEKAYSRRGIWIARAEFPEIFVVFGAPNAKPIPALAFGALMNFENYDLWAPSVQLADPFSQRPYKAKELPLWGQLLKRRTGSSTVPTGLEDCERFMQWVNPDDIPFLCHPGVREYHENVAHSGDSWLLHRTSGEGTLSRLVDLLFDFGSSKMGGFGAMPLINLPS